MKPHQLSKTTTRSKKRLGRGYGSGKGGHTSSRGQKGQKSRSSVHTWFEGGQLPLSRRLPFLRGKDRFKSLRSENIIIKTGNLQSLPAKTIVTPQVLVKHNLVSIKEAASGHLKILSGGELTTSLTIKGIPTSSGAAKIITAAGGTIDSTTNTQSK